MYFLHAFPLLVYTVNASNGQSNYSSCIHFSSRTAKAMTLLVIEVVPVRSLTWIDEAIFFENVNV